MACLTEMESDAASTEKPSVDDDDDVKEKETTVIVKATKLGNKVRRRMYGRITSQLRNAKLRTKETVERLNFTVDLVTQFRIIHTFYSKLQLYTVSQKNCADLFLSQLRQISTDFNIF